MPGILNAATLAPAAGFLYYAAKYHSRPYICVGLLVLAAFYLAYSRWRAFSRFPVGIVTMLTVAIALPALGFWQYAQFSDIGDADHAAYESLLWNLRHGLPHYSYRGMNMLGIHSQYTSLLWIPLHALAGPAGMKLANGFCFIAAALLIGRRLREHTGAAAWAIAAVLLCPPVASQFFYGFHAEILAAPFLILLLEAYREEKLGRFLACAFFLAFTKEVFTLSVGGLLLLALMEKRNWKWILLPGLLCCAQMAVYWFIVIPWIAPKGMHLGYMMPTTGMQVVRDWFRAETLTYVFQAYIPLVPLLAAMPKRYWILPAPLMIFYAGFPDAAFEVMWVNYGFPISLTLAGTIVLRKEWPEEGQAKARTMAACAVAALLCYPSWREIFSVPKPNPSRAAVTAARRMIPDDAPVLVSGPFLSRFTAREVGEAWGWNERPWSAFDYVVVDSAYHPGWNVDSVDLERKVRRLTVSPDWKKDLEQGNVMLFRRVGRSGDMDSAGGDWRPKP